MINFKESREGANEGSASYGSVANEGETSLASGFPSIPENSHTQSLIKYCVQCDINN